MYIHTSSNKQIISLNSINELVFVVTIQQVTCKIVIKFLNIT